MLPGAVNFPQQRRQIGRGLLWCIQFAAIGAKAAEGTAEGDMDIKAKRIQSRYIRETIRRAGLEDKWLQ